LRVIKFLSQPVKAPGNPGGNMHRLLNDYKLHSSVQAAVIRAGDLSSPFYRLHGCCENNPAKYSADEPTGFV